MAAAAEAIAGAAALGALGVPAAVALPPPALVPYVAGAAEPSWALDQFIGLVKQQVASHLLKSDPTTGVRVYSNLCQFLMSQYSAPNPQDPNAVDKLGDFCRDLQSIHFAIILATGTADDNPVTVVPAATPSDPQRGLPHLRVRLWDFSFHNRASPRGCTFRVPRSSAPQI